MKKSLIVFLIAAVLIMSVFPANAVSDGIVLVIDYPEDFPKAEETFDITVSIENNPGICGVEFVLTFDKDKLVCKGISGGELVSGSLAVTNPDVDKGAKFATISLNAFQGDKTIAKCEFTAKENIKEFDFGLENVSILDADGKNADYTIKNKKTEKPSRPVTPGNDDEEYEELPEEEIPEVVAFPDVENHWAKEYVNKSAELGLFKGDDKGNFNPDAPVTRAQFVTVLWRMAGKPEVVDETPFADTKNQIGEFKSAIAWGYKNGYINGTTETTFDPDGTLTREAGMKILHFYSGGKSGNEMLLASIYNGIFIDSKDISDWAKPSVYWGIYNKLISGTNADTLTPKGTATRAQLAKILVNYIDTYNN